MQVKKKILEELEVPPEAQEGGVSWKNLHQLKPSSLWEGVFPLYRDRFTGEMMMYLRPV